MLSLIIKLPTNISIRKGLKLRDKTIAIIYLVLMSIQIIPIEGQELSWIKILLIVLSPILLFALSPYKSEALKLGGLYILMLIVSVLINKEDFRFTSFFYRIGGIVVFILYYNLIYINKCLIRDSFIKIVKGLIVAYGVVLIIQQFFNVTLFHGLGNVSFLNLISTSQRSILCGNSLSVEPSHSARILGALFITFFRLIQIEAHSPLKTIKTIWNKYKGTLILFLWSMLTMDSGTAIIVLAILVLLLTKEKYILVGVIISILSISVIATTVDFTPLNRAMAAATSINTGDIKEVQKADLSASARIIPYLYTYQNFDFSNKSIWFGEGIDTAKNRDETGVFRFIGQIDDYGLIPYIFSLILFYKCCIRSFISVESIFFMVALMMELGNMYYVWCVCMLFTTIKYFYSRNS